MTRLSLRFFTTMALLIAVCANSWAQKPMFGYINFDNVLHAMNDYTTVQLAMKDLRTQYDKEANYNEDKFFKMYSEYIQGQKSFPEDIMLKRQKELQVAMEQGINFREESEKLLRKAEQEMLQPLYHKLDSAIAFVAKEKGLAFVLNTQGHACPYINPQEGIDITVMVQAVLMGKPLRKEETDSTTAMQQEHKLPVMPDVNTLQQ